MTLIGLAGYSHVGKDAVASFLVEHHQFTRVAFADQLKKTLYDMNPIVELDTDDQWRTGISISHVPFQVLLEYSNWEESKKVVAVRELLQRLGMAVRDNVSQTAWIDAAFRVADQYGRVIFSDVRMPNEADTIQDRGGKVVRVWRPGVSAVNSHISERALDNYPVDATIHNDYTLDSLGTEVERVMARLDVL